MGHYLYFVLIDKKDASNSKEAREQATDELDNNGFVYSGGYFGGGKCDCYVIGGRWSGFLSNSEDEPERNTYLDYGYEDDALILTKQLLKELKGRVKEVLCFIPSTSEELIVGALDEDHIDNYWIVVVDYHS